MKITLHKQQDCFFPYDQESLDYVKKLTENGQYVVEIKRQRNPKYHGYAMKMLTQLYDMVETDLAFDPWRKMLAIKAGLFTTLGKVDIKGTTTVAVQADSLSFENLDEDEFHEVFRALLQAFIQKYGEIVTYDELCEWSVM